MGGLEVCGGRFQRVVVVVCAFGIFDPKCEIWMLRHVELESESVLQE